MVFCNFAGCRAYATRLRSRRKCYGPLFLNFLDPPLQFCALIMTSYTINNKLDDL